MILICAIYMLHPCLCGLLRQSFKKLLSILVHSFNKEFIKYLWTAPTTLYESLPSGNLQAIREKHGSFLRLHASWPLCKLWACVYLLLLFWDTFFWYSSFLIDHPFCSSLLELHPNHTHLPQMCHSYLSWALFLFFYLVILLVSMDTMIISMLVIKKNLLYPTLTSLLTSSLTSPAAYYWTSQTGHPIDIINSACPKPNSLSLPPNWILFLTFLVLCRVSLVFQSLRKKDWSKSERNLPVLQPWGEQLYHLAVSFLK